MKILFLCTAHNSLSQRLYLELSSLGHDISIEYAVSSRVMEEAVLLFQPDLVICPFLTARVPKEIYNRFLTLIVHPGPPGDAGPSALDWLLMGCDGSIEDSDTALAALNAGVETVGRTHWGVTVLQAIEDLDAGPIWAFEQFTVNIDDPQLTKSELYRGAVTSSAVTAIRAAISRVRSATNGRRMSILLKHSSNFVPSLHADPLYGRLSVTDNIPFQGGITCNRSLLKAAQRDFDLNVHTAQQISRRIRSADTQPGVLSKVFGVSLYIYGGMLEESPDMSQAITVSGTSTKILRALNDAVCIATRDGHGVWITHVRRPKGQNSSLQPKVPATQGLLELGILNSTQVDALYWRFATDRSLARSHALQDLWVDIIIDGNQKRTAYLHWEFYNGAADTKQCQRLIEAMGYILSQSTPVNPLHAIVLMGGSYFCNGIALNVIESSADPAGESWSNINAINDVVHYVLHEFPSRGILTIAAIRGNAAAGGFALATACDIVISGAESVLNPAYRAIGLFGSEYHTLTYPARCGNAKAESILRTMLPMSPLQAQRIGLVDYIFPGTGEELDNYIRTHISMLLEPGTLTRGFWKHNVDLSSVNLSGVRAFELGEMSKDFWSPRSMRYHSRRFDFVRKVKPSSTPLRFAKHRRFCGGSSLDEEETDRFDDVEYFRWNEEEAMLAELRQRVRVEERIRSRRPSIAQLAPLETPRTVEIPPVPKRDSKIETLFSCYYAAPVEVPLTPPETPFDGKVSLPFLMDVDASRVS